MRSELAAYGSDYTAAVGAFIRGNTCHVITYCCDVTANTENTTSSTVACWTEITEMWPGKALIKSVTLE
jgi:hypothetical protein